MGRGRRVTIDDIGELVENFEHNFSTYHEVDDSPLLLIKAIYSIYQESIDGREGKSIDLASSIMKCNTWESRKENAILSGYGKIQAININRKRRNNHHVIREEVIG